MKIKIIFLLCIFFSLHCTSKLKDILIKENKVSCALFTSQHNIADILIELINNEKKSIKAAIFLLSHQKIAQALINAKKRNINIEIMTDHNNHKHKYSKIPLLKNIGIPIYIYGSDDKIPALMHNKFFIFEQNIENKNLLWTGSFNCTKNSQAKNKENVIILEEKHLIQVYNDEFEIIKKNSRNISMRKNEPKKISISNNNISKSSQKFLKSMKIKIS